MDGKGEYEDERWILGGYFIVLREEELFKIVND